MDHLRWQVAASSGKMLLEQQSWWCGAVSPRTVCCSRLGRAREVSGLSCSYLLCCQHTTPITANKLLHTLHWLSSRCGDTHWATSAASRIGSQPSDCIDA